jgi:hypothetical protein
VVYEKEHLRLYELEMNTLWQLVNIMILFWHGINHPGVDPVAI